MMIPHIIHQIWFQGKNSIPESYNENIDSVKKFNPHWKYIIWDNESILDLIKDDKDINTTYNSLVHLHQKVDYAKYVILYKFGGIYVDMDVKQEKSFDSLLEKYKGYNLIVSLLDLGKVEAYFSCYRGRCINNGVIISPKKTDIMKTIILYINKNYKCSSFGIKEYCINSTTGPDMFTSVITDYMSKNKDNKILLLPPEYLEPCIPNKCKITKNTYTVHKHDNTWIHPGFIYFINFYYANKIITWIILIILIIFIIMTIKKYFRMIYN